MFEDITSAIVLFPRKAKARTQQWAQEGKAWVGSTPSCGSWEAQDTSPKLEVSALPSSICVHLSHLSSNIYLGSGLE